MASRRWFLSGLAGAAAALILGLWLSAPGDEPAWRGEFATTTGERREVALPDGSRMHLDAMTRAVCEFDGGLRRVRLAEGRAVFEVVSERGRAFEVDAGGRSVVVVGTRFEVDVASGGGDALRVAVEEGVVELRREDRVRWVALRAGQRTAWRTGDRAPEVTALAAGGFATWREARLRYRNEPLTGVIADLRRNYAGRIDAEGAGLEELRMTGTLPTDDMEVAFGMLEAALPVRVERVAGGVVIRGGAKAP